MERSAQKCAGRGPKEVLTEYALHEIFVFLGTCVWQALTIRTYFLGRMEG